LVTLLLVVVPFGFVRGFVGLGCSFVYHGLFTVCYLIFFFFCCCSHVLRYVWVTTYHVSLVYVLPVRFCGLRFDALVARCGLVGLVYTPFTAFGYVTVRFGLHGWLVVYVRLVGCWFHGLPRLPFVHVWLRLLVLAVPVVAFTFTVCFAPFGCYTHTATFGSRCFVAHVCSLPRVLRTFRWFTVWFGLVVVRCWLFGSLVPVWFWFVYGFTLLVCGSTVSVCVWFAFPVGSWLVVCWCSFVLVRFVRLVLSLVR